MGIPGQVRIALLGLAFAGGGCASAGLTRTATPDLRGNATVSTPQPRLLVAGPIELLHVNVERKAGATFLRVPRLAGAMPDCRSGAPLAWDGESDLYVRQDESVCVAVVHDARVSWHARSVPPGLESGTRHASLR